MSDIDFDELDRAVASVLGGAPAAPAQPQPAAPQQTTTPAAVQPVPATTPALTNSEAPTNRSVPAQSLHAQPIKPVQRGRFLDMVHPSGDMTPRGNPALSSRPVPVASNAAFVSDVIAPSTPVATPAVAPTVPAATLAPAITPPVDTPKFELPTDFFAASPDDSNPHKGPDAPVSPFIADAKVEKRPLGAFAGTESSLFSQPSQQVDIRTQLLDVEKEDNLVEAEGAAPTASQPAPETSAVIAPVEKPKKRHSLFEHHKIPQEALQEPTQSVSETPTSLPALADKDPKYGKGTFIWITVGIAVMLIGFGVGATLYFRFMT